MTVLKVTLLLLTFIARSIVAQEKTHRTVCYIQSWTHWRQEPVKFEPEDIDSSLCTHLAWDSAGLDASGTNITYDQDEQELLLRLTDVKRYAPHLKVLLTIGGWDMGSEEFTALVSSRHNMQTFATHAITFLRQFNFDGLILNWEFPAIRPPSVPQDKHRYTVLLRTLMEAFQNEANGTRERLLLVSVLSPQSWQVTQSYELPDISKYVDWFDLTTFDLHGSWDGAVSHHSPLYSVSHNDQDSIHYMIQRLIDMNVPKDKLDLGIPFYGVSFNLADPTDHDIGAPSTGDGAPGKLSDQGGRLAWFEICQLISNSSFTHGQLSGTKAPFVVDGSRWTGYDDVASIQEKVDYVMQNDLGGVSVFTVDMDDYQGLCGGEIYPLLHAVRNQFGSAPVGK